MIAAREEEVVAIQDRLQKGILVALADSEMKKILDSVMLHPKSVNEIARETGIPNTTAYRKMKWMVEEGLLIVSSIRITEDGKKTSLLRSTFRSINITYENGEIAIKAEKNAGFVEKMAEEFFSFDR